MKLGVCLESPLVRPNDLDFGNKALALDEQGEGFEVLQHDVYLGPTLAPVKSSNSPD